jgi:hypothetical protein
MSGQHLGNTEPEFTYRDINQLMEDAKKLRTKMISEAMRDINNRLGSVLTKWAVGAFQLKRNKRVKLIQPIKN